MILNVCVEIENKSHWIEMPHRLYYEFVHKSLLTLQSLKPEVSKIHASKDFCKTNLDKLYENQMAMNGVVVYSALALEAYINYYATRYAIAFHKDYEKSLSTLNKWKIYPHLKTKKILSEDVLEKIKKIFKLRNDIVHPKSSKAVVGGAQSGSLNIQKKIKSMDMKSFVVDLNSIFNAVSKIDGDEKAMNKQNPWLIYD